MNTKEQSGTTIDKFHAWALKHPNLFVSILVSAALVTGIVLGKMSKKEEPPPPKIKKVESWSHYRYHFVNMWSSTDEQYTMICDRHTGVESLLAKAYKYPRRDSREDGVITTMTSIHMGFNQDCFNRDVNAYNLRGRRSP